MGVDRDWGLLNATLAVPRLHSDLRHGLVTLLEDRANNLQAEKVLLGNAEAGEQPPVSVHERIYTADVLAGIGDPRFPVTREQWQAAPLAPTFTAEGTHYWRYVPAATYRIGGWEAGEPQADIAMPQFWIARYQVTVTQYQQFMQAGGYDREDWWTPEGWRWLAKKRTEPNYWERQTTQQSRNQPVYGVAWYEARAFCGWLNSSQTHYQVRLPTEAEWEAAAAYDEHGERHTYPWGDDAITLERAIYDEHAMNNRPAPVGTCMAGRAANGALDMSGNLWEWTHSVWENYPEQANKANIIGDGTDVSIRGGSWYIVHQYGRCAVRNYSLPFYLGSNLGFRLVCALRS